MRSSTTIILARAGVSFISSDQACANAESEIPDFDFEGTRSSSEEQWRDILNRVQVNTTGVEDETIELLYSSVRTLIHLQFLDLMYYSSAL